MIFSSLCHLYSNLFSKYKLVEYCNTAANKLCVDTVLFVPYSCKCTVMSKAFGNYLSKICLHYFNVTKASSDPL